VPGKKRIPVQPGQIRFLLSLAPYPTEEALAKALGTSARYLRRMLTGARPGYKYSGKIWKLYQSHRRKGTPQKPPKRIPKPTRGFVSMASVVGVLQYIFQPTDAQAVPSRHRKWQDRETLFATTERKVRGKFDSWDAFSIVMVQGATDAGTVSIRRYHKKGGGQHHLEGFEEARLEEVEEYESSTLEEIMERWESLPEKLAQVVEHLDIGGWLETAQEVVFSEPIFNFWACRMSERPKAGEFGLARDPRDPQTRKVMESNCYEAALGANGEDFQYDFLGMYAFSGWNKKPGKKPPRQ
jgi:hypothetical protein